MPLQGETRRPEPERCCDRCETCEWCRCTCSTLEGKE